MSREHDYVNARAEADELRAELRAASERADEMERQKDGWLRSALDAKDAHREEVERLRREIERLQAVIDVMLGQFGGSLT